MANIELQIHFNTLSKTYLHGASAGSRTNTVVAAGLEPSSVPFPVGFLPFTEEADKTSPGHS